jgi:LysM repeat protein
MKYLLLFLFSCITFVNAEDNQKNFDFYSNTKTHHITFGESLARIALEHKVSVSFLLSLNKKISNPNRIFGGQKIKVPNDKAVKYLTEQSMTLKPLLMKLGAQASKDRIKAVKEMILQDWRVIPLLLNALKDKDVEIRENAREALREIHKSQARPSLLKFKLN